MPDKKQTLSLPDNFVIYQTEDNQVSVDVLFDEETVWMTLDQIALLFDKSRSTVNEHVLHIYAEQELDENGTKRKIGNPDFTGKPTNYYNLDVIISVGYRVKSKRGIQFRQWATKRLHEYIRKGYTLDDERLKKMGGGDYFSELLERIRDIRASEKVFYRQILDIYATSIDYDPNSPVSRQFFQKVQNKIHYAVHGQTAAEVIYHRVDADAEFMGLHTFTGDRPRLRDVETAKNYLDEQELRALGQIVSGYLDFAQRQAERREYMTMADWAVHLDRILTSTGEQLLTGAGTVSRRQALDKAHREYRKYQQRTLSRVEQDFLQHIRQLTKQTKSGMQFRPAKTKRK